MNNLEFIEDTHTYLYNGVIIPSVSDIVKFRFPDMYRNIPRTILEEKAKYGSTFHKLVEDYLKGNVNKNGKRIDPYLKVSFKRFVEEYKKHPVEIEDMEQPVCYEGRYAGTYDIRTKAGDIIDIKTTQTLHVDNEGLEAPLNLQISLYYLALGKMKPVGYCWWYPKGPNKTVEVRCWGTDKLLELLDRYEQANKSVIDF